MGRKAGLILNTRCGSVMRQVQTNAGVLENCVEISNRNPRNLELMRIARKPAGYYLEKPGREYWNKLIITVTGRHVEAVVYHFKNGPVVTVSTREWGLKKQLYKTLDTAAFTNVGRLLAQRCLECGISAVRCDVEVKDSKRNAALLEEIKKGGVSLEELEMYKHANPWDQFRMTKPWTIEE